MATASENVASARYTPASRSAISPKSRPNTPDATAASGTPIQYGQPALCASTAAT